MAEILDQKKNNKFIILDKNLCQKSKFKKKN